MRQQREEQRTAKRTKMTEDEDDDGGIQISVIRVKLTSTPTDLYEYDTAASHHTTHELHRMRDIRDVKLEVKGHDGTTTYCHKQGTDIYENVT